MVSRKELKDYGFKTLIEYYDYILDSLINGQLEHTINLIHELSKPQAVEFIQNLKVYEVPEEYARELTALTLQALKR